MSRTDPSLLLRALDTSSRESFFHFVWRSFGTLHHGQERFVPAWHVRAMCHELEQVQHGTCKRLVINIPPRCLKSVTVAVAYTAFLLGHDPGMKIMVATYGLDLARKHSEDCRKIMQAQWYRDLFPATRLAPRGCTQDELRTTLGGSRKAISTAGPVTGHGADLIIIDDLMKARDAASEAELERARNFIEGTLLSRFNNPAEGRVVLVAQRLHELDPPGHLLEKGTYRHLNLPAIAEEEQDIAIGRGKVHRREVGSALFPERLGLDVLQRLRREMGSAVFNCHYQQNPIAPDGSPLRWEWFGTYEDAGDRASFQLIVQSWDTAMSADPRSHYSVCTTWGFRDNVWLLLDVFRDRLEFPDLKRQVLDLARRWRADRVLIEKAASGVPLLQECFQIDRSTFRAVVPHEDKEIRFRAACAPVEEGRVLLPRDAAWLPEFKRELQSFPRGRNDDQADSFSQFLKWSIGNGFWRSLHHDHPLIQARRAQQERNRRRR